MSRDAITHGYIIYNNSGGAWDFWTGDGDAGWDTLAGDSVATNTWSHIAITYDAGTDTKTLWIDGALSATDNVPQSANSVCPEWQRRDGRPSHRFGSG